MSHHITNNDSSLGDVTPYTSNDSVTIGNSNSISISTCGNTTLTIDDCKLHLPNVLHIPNMSHNMLFVQKLCAKNEKFIKFHANKFLVKDAISKKVVIQGKASNGLYSLGSTTTIGSTKLVCHFTRVHEASLWHSRLAYA